MRVGSLMYGLVVKNHPEKSAYLVMTGDHPGELVVLPKSQANRAYRVFDSVVAVVMDCRKPYPLITQLGPLFFKAISQMLLNPVIVPHGVQVWRVAGATGAPFFKVGLVGEGAAGLLKDLVGLVKLFLQYTGKVVCFVPLNGHPEHDIPQALLPAPIDRIKKCNVYPIARESRVLVPKEVMGQFLGVQGWNVLTAGKLLRWKIVIEES